MKIKELASASLRLKWGILLGTPVLIGIFLYLTYSSKVQQNNEIVVSIKPLHSLVCALTKGVTKPVLLLDGYLSPHHVQLIPLQVQTMQKAKAMIWIGPSYEQPIYKHIETSSNILTIQGSPSINLKKLRNGAFWDACCDHHHDHTHHHAASATKYEGINIDGHIWLDPLMMIQVVDVILQHLKPLYPTHQEVLEQNARAYKKRLTKLHQNLLKQMKPYKGQAYIIQHDGNQYFDNAYGVQTIATISIDPGIPPSAGHLLKIRQAISRGEIHPRCLYTERQIDGILARSYADTLRLSYSVLDYLGADIPAGEYAYETLMQEYVNSFITGMLGSSGL